jgi:hypothetical protein
VSIKQTEIGTIHSLENFMQNFVLPTETVMVAHPVLNILQISVKPVHLIKTV